MTEQEEASRPATGHPPQQPTSAPAAPANSVFQQPSRSSRNTAEQEALEFHVDNRAANTMKHPPQRRIESGHQSSRTVPKSRASQPAPEPESSGSSSSEHDTDSEDDHPPPPPQRHGAQRRGQAEAPAASQSSRERGSHRDGGSQGRTERQSAVETVRAFTGGRRSEEDTTRPRSNGYQSQEYEPAAASQSAQQPTREPTSYTSSIFNEFERRAGANGIDVRAPSDRGDLRRQRGLAEYGHLTRQRAQIAEDAALAREMDAGEGVNTHEGHRPVWGTNFSTNDAGLRR